MSLQPPFHQPGSADARSQHELVHLKEVREKLLLREAQLSQAQRMAGMASWEWYFGDTTIRWSPEMYLFWGYEPGEINVDLDSVASWTHLDDLPILQTAIGKALAGEDVEMEYRRYDKCGNEIFIHTIGRIIRGENGEPLGVFGIDMNITRRKQQELHLAELNRSLEEKNRELAKRNAELASFSYVATHDLQEPLRKIQLFNSLILDQESGCLSDAARQYFARSMAAAERMQGLLKDLITYSQAKTAGQPRQPVSLAALVNDVRRDLHDTIAATGAVIETPDLPVVTVQESMFRQLLDNLLSNALTYTRNGVAPRIRLTYGTKPGEQLLIPQANPRATYHALAVVDNGIGFEPEHRERIFQLFRRLHRRDEYAGTGIGLAICQRIMDSHDGFITADAVAGQGATFTVYWPV